MLYEPSSQLGVVLFGVNNPHMNVDEIPDYKICPEILNYPLISELTAPEDVYKGVSFACSVDDAKKVIADIPDLTVSGVL